MMRAISCVSIGNRFFSARRKTQTKSGPSGPLRKLARKTIHCLGLYGTFCAIYRQNGAPGKAAATLPVNGESAVESAESRGRGGLVGARASRTDVDWRPVGDGVPNLDDGGIADRKAPGGPIAVPLGRIVGAVVARQAVNEDRPARVGMPRLGPLAVRVVRIGDVKFARV